MTSNRLKLHKTTSDTFRVLVNDAVHPKLVGFHTVEEALKKAQSMYPNTVVELLKLDSQISTVYQ